MLTKSFINKTGHELEITLYFAEKHGPALLTYGSRIQNIKSGDTNTIPFGDLHHAFLQGIRIKTLSSSESTSLQRATRQAEGSLFTLLNENDDFQIFANKHTFGLKPLT